MSVAAARSRAGGKSGTKWPGLRTPRKLTDGKVTDGVAGRALTRFAGRKTRDTRNAKRRGRTRSIDGTRDPVRVCYAPPMPALNHVRGELCRAWDRLIPALAGMKVAETRRHFSAPRETRFSAPPLWGSTRATLAEGGAVESLRPPSILVIPAEAGVPLCHARAGGHPVAAGACSYHRHHHLVMAGLGPGHPRFRISAGWTARAEHAPGAAGPLSSVQAIYGPICVGRGRPLTRCSETGRNLNHKIRSRNPHHVRDPMHKHRRRSYLVPGGLLICVVATNLSSPLRTSLTLRIPRPLRGAFMRRREAGRGAAPARRRHATPVPGRHRSSLRGH